MELFLIGLDCLNLKVEPRLSNIKSSVRTAKKTPYFTVRKVSLLTLFKEITAVYIDLSIRDIQRKYTATGC
jgi:hypothetical protein